MFSCESNWYIFSEHFCLYKLKNKIDNCNHCVTGRYKEPPREMPNFLKSAYSYQNRVSIGKWYLNRDFGDPNGSHPPEAFGSPPIGFSQPSEHSCLPVPFRLYFQLSDLLRVVGYKKILPRFIHLILSCFSFLSSKFRKKTFV